MNETTSKNEFIEFTVCNKPYAIINGIVYERSGEGNKICDITILNRELPQFAGVVAVLAFNTGYENGKNDGVTETQNGIKKLLGIA